MSLQIMTLTGMSKKLNILKYKTRRFILGVIFSPFLVSQAIKRETSPGTTGKTSEDESEVRENEKRRFSRIRID